MPVMANETYNYLSDQVKKKMLDLQELISIMQHDEVIGPMLVSLNESADTNAQSKKRKNGFNVYLYRHLIIGSQLLVEISKCTKNEKGEQKLVSIIQIEVPIMQVDHRFIKWIDVIADSCHHDGTRTRGSLDVSRSGIKSKNEIKRVVISSQKNRYHGLTNEEEIIELLIGMYEDVFNLNNSKRLSNGHIALFRDGEKSVRDYIKKPEGSDCQGSSFKMS